jgi:hypothetical protein
MKKILILLVFSSFCFAQQENPVFYKNQKKINEIAQSIEFNGTNLRTELVKNNITVTMAMVRKITAEDAKQDPSVHKGDVEYEFHITDDSQAIPCGTGTMYGPDFLYHKGVFIPESLTAAWLMSYGCDWPNK